MSKKSQNEVLTRDAQAIAGVRQHLMGGGTLSLVGVKYTPAALVDLLQSQIDAIASANVAGALWHAAVERYRAIDAEVTAVVRRLRLRACDEFGPDSPLLADFGFAPPRLPVLTPAQIVARSAKAAATRKARRTMGSRKKKAVKGNVKAVVISPVLPAEPDEDLNALPDGSTI